jgi:hypothetical protein
MVVKDLDSGVDTVVRSERYDQNPDWSPDGTRIVFQSADHLRGTYHIYTMDPDGSNVAQLTHDEGWLNIGPRWSPDGSKIAFVSDRDGPSREQVFHLYIMDANGDNLTQLTADETYMDGAFSWSPDGTHIAVARSVGLGPPHIFVIRSDGSGALQITDSDAWEASPAWSPDGTRIAFHADVGGNLDIYAVDVPAGVLNTAPSATADQESAIVNEGQMAANSGAVSDPDGDTVTLNASIGAVTNHSDGTWSWSFETSDGPIESQTVTIYADDGNGGEASVSFDLLVNNVDPTIALTGRALVDEGDTESYSYTLSDPGADTFTLVSANCGADGEPSNSTFDPNTGTGSFDCTFPDGPATTGISVTVEDDDGGSGSDSILVTVSNVAPTIDSLTVPWEVPINIDQHASFTVDVVFNDRAGAYDAPYVCAFDLDYDGVTFESDVVVPYVAGTSCSTALIYVEPGVYTVKVIVTDKDGGSGSATATDYIVIYNPEGGFVTGGGWIWSEPGWCQLDEVCTGAEGKANFGFVSKYKKGASVPTGNTEFNFKAGVLNFHSDTYQWLVVNQDGTNAQYKGAGTINGDVAPNGRAYKLMLWAGDLDPAGDDTFRIKIWYEAGGSEVVVYDNGFYQAIGGGNIVVHTK